MLTKADGLVDNILSVPYGDVTAPYKVLWRFIVLELLPHVSVPWSERVEKFGVLSLQEEDFLRQFRHGERLGICLHTDGIRYDVLDMSGGRRSKRPYV